MSLLELDPPPRRLQLVSSSDGPSARDQRYRTSGQLAGPFRQLYRNVLQAAVRAGQPINADALRVVLVAKQSMHTTPATQFTTIDVWQLMFVDVMAWCRNRRLDVPIGCAAAITTTVRWLDESGELDPDSDPLADLLDAIDECTGGWSDSSTALPSNGGPKRS